MTDRTLVLCKPDAVERGLVGEIIGRIERKGLTIAALELKHVSDELARAHYAEHAGKGFFGSLVAYMTSGPVFVAVLERENAVAHWRAVMGATNPANADEGTIRKEFGQSIERNAAHGSANLADAAREVTFFFSQAELI